MSDIVTLVKTITEKHDIIAIIPLIDKLQEINTAHSIYQLRRVLRSLSKIRHVCKQHMDFHKRFSVGIDRLKEGETIRIHNRDSNNRELIEIVQRRGWILVEIEWGEQTETQRFPDEARVIYAFTNFCSELEEIFCLELNGIDNMLSEVIACFDKIR